MLLEFQFRMPICRRNFVLNPLNGLLIRPYYGYQQRIEKGDVELAYLLGWLLHLAPLEDVRTEQNVHWR